MEGTPRAVRVLSRKKKLAFTAAALLLAWPLLELLSWGALNFFQGAGIEEIRKARKVLAQSGTRGSSGTETIHPYLGWVLNPQTSEGSSVLGRSMPVNAFGFVDEEREISKRRPDRLIVGITGGSVAWQMSVAGEEAFQRKLRENPAFRDREIQIVRLAMSGYKQPQQLMALNFMLALGAEFDAIVNVDGYNEIALPSCENDKADVFAAYPRMWHARMQDVVDPRTYSVSYRLLQLRAVRQELAADRCASWAPWSYALELVWYLRNRRLEYQVVELGETLRDHTLSDGNGFAAQGPPQIYHGTDELYSHLVGIWSNSSLQMHQICRSNGIVYLHAIQPNQYVPGSKPLAAIEKEKMFIPDQEYGHAIARGYPLLIDEAARLREQGVDFHDFTKLFANIEEPIYVDYFCHYNQQGNDMLAEAVAAALGRAFESMNKGPRESE